ncbi:MAG TPA: hypothetical protein VK137_03465, partial [Planctomycetaceae bacterium]|nr:hypothetical protein [Planctomycetaceae bacterium]
FGRHVAGELIRVAVVVFGPLDENVPFGFGFGLLLRLGRRIVVFHREDVVVLGGDFRQRRTSRFGFRGDRIFTAIVGVGLCLSGSRFFGNFVKYPAFGAAHLGTHEAGGDFDPLSATRAVDGIEHSSCEAASGLIRDSFGNTHKHVFQIDFLFLEHLQAEAVLHQQLGDEAAVVDAVVECHLERHADVQSVEFNEQDDFLRVTLKDTVKDGSFIAELLVKSNLRLKTLKEEEIDLEDVFMAITKGITN